MTVVPIIELDLKRGRFEPNASMLNAQNPTKTAVAQCTLHRNRLQQLDTEYHFSAETSNVPKLTHQRRARPWSIVNRPKLNQQKESICNNFRYSSPCAAKGSLVLFITSENILLILKHSRPAMHPPSSPRVQQREWATRARCSGKARTARLECLCLEAYVAVYMA
eukprot:9475373-Pyramimonas_sp.AAC.1